MPTSTAVLVDEIKTDSNDDTEIVQEYKNLNDKCDAVLDKINKRKKNVKKSKQ